MAETRIKSEHCFAVIGAGSWGTALAIQFSRSGHRTELWGRDGDQVAAMAAARVNAKYLPDAPFPDDLHVTDDLAAALTRADDVVVAVPSHAFRETLQAIAAVRARYHGLCWATKGFENETGLLPHQVVAATLPDAPPTAVLSGPTFAAEVARELPSAMTIASASDGYARHLAVAITTDAFRAYVSDDIVGVEVGGATKNIYAIGAGLTDGLGFGANSRVALLTRGLAEMTRLGVALGARKETFMGLAGIGDLVLTCTDDQSRNRRFGLALATGKSAADARRSIGQVVEGYYAAKAVHQVREREGIDMPIAEQLYQVLYEDLEPLDAVHALMSRPIMREN
ncbi:MAG: NAD(P)H-dependent glycerol-3-phosphate dehydrogenase [Gammaproteobacteria bacterium]|nr:NAD(P)H-dependent glycerol-3-phosphate dehydrogenase [Gammaproteobacteria bacterium]